MAALVKVWFLLMLPINTSLFNLQEPLYLFGTKGLHVTLQMFCRDLAEGISFYRSDQQQRPWNKTTPGRYVNHGYLPVLISENQEFVSECWKQGTLLERRHFHVIVCAEKDAEEKMSLHHGAPADMMCQKFNPRRGETLQVFKNIQNDTYKWSSTMILDTNVSLEIIPDVLRSRVVNNGSLIHFSDVSNVDSGVYSCVVWRDHQCQNYRETSLDVQIQEIFLEPKQSFTLSCLAKDVKQGSMLAWWYPVGLNLPGLKSDYDQSEMLNDTQSGNYSLVIPHVTLKHSGTYTCRAIQKYYNVVNIFVCSDLEPTNMTFSSGDVANLTCHPNLADTLRVQWYREYNQSSTYLLTDTQDGFVNEKMKNRLKASNSQSYISLSELLITDAGSYWCRVWGINDATKGLCFKRRVHLTYVGHYEGTFYIVYASLMASVLLGMIITVVCVTVLTRKRRPPGDI